MLTTIDRFCYIKDLISISQAGGSELQNQTSQAHILLDFVSVLVLIYLSTKQWSDAYLSLQPAWNKNSSEISIAQFVLVSATSNTN